MANFEFELKQELKLTILWKHPPASEDEEKYRQNIEAAMNEMAVSVNFYAEEHAKPVAEKIMQAFTDLWLEYNP